MREEPRDLAIVFLWAYYLVLEIRGAIAAAVVSPTDLETRWGWLVVSSLGQVLLLCLEASWATSLIRLQMCVQWRISNFGLQKSSMLKITCNQQTNQVFKTTKSIHCSRFMLYHQMTSVFLLLHIKGAHTIAWIQLYSSTLLVSIPTRICQDPINRCTLTMCSVLITSITLMQGNMVQRCSQSRAAAIFYVIPYSACLQFGSIVPAKLLQSLASMANSFQSEVKMS